MYQDKFKIVSNKKVADNCCKLKVSGPEVAKAAKPGQFIHVRIQDDIDKPLLRRPFAVHNVKDKRTFEILYKIRGLGTKILSSKQKNEALDIIGPLGNGFDIDNVNNKILVVAGGIGIAPLLFLIKELIRKHKEVITFMGASCKDNILCHSEINRLGSEVIIATEDGSQGKKAKITEVLADFLSGNKDLSDIAIFASGPKNMLKIIAELSNKYNIPAEVSLDEIIACGVGACLGCAVMTKQGYKLVCKDGPVFKAGDIVWD